MRDNHFVICSCGSSEHTLRFMHDQDNKEMYVDVYLNNYNNIFKRCLIAIKYVLGYNSKYGHFDCTILSKSEAKKLSFFIKAFCK